MRDLVQADSAPAIFGDHELEQPVPGADALGIAVIGPGAIADFHVRATARTGARIRTVVGPDADENDEFAARHGIGESSTNLEQVLERADIDAVIISSPSPVHQLQTMLALDAGKDVLCEIPVAMDYAGAQQVAAAAADKGRQVMVAHTGRFWEPFRYVRSLVEEGEFTVAHVVARSFQLRQENRGWTGRPRGWTDSILWHHAAHLVDMALWLLDAETVEACGFVGPPWSGSATPMDVSISLSAPHGGVASLSLSYHSRFAISDYLIVGESVSFRVEGGRLSGPDGVVLGVSDPAPVQERAIVMQDREFVAALVEDRAPASSVTDILPAMRVLQRVQDLTGM